MHEIKCAKKFCSINCTVYPLMLHILYYACISYTETQKGGIYLSATGYIQVRAYTSDAQIPLENVTIMITRPDGSAIAMRLTDRSGKIEPIRIDVPNRAASQSPDSGVIPFTAVNIYARLENFEQIEAENVQVFADTVTFQNLEMIPLSELPNSWTKTEVFDTPAQNL